jgi:predicted Zn-dependent peptidase
MRPKVMTVVRAALLTLLAGMVCSSRAVAAGTAEEFHHEVLPNGLRILLHPREGARNVSMRVLVQVGMLDFPCGKRETPHFLEHLIFAGTRTHTEGDLDTLIRNQGGEWTAYTGAKATWYEVEMYSGRYRLGLRLLHEMLTEPLLSTESVETSRRIIQRESGEEEGHLREWMYAMGFGKSAAAKALEAFGHACSTLETPRHITRKEIIDTWRRTYVASNMAVILVGNFKQAEALREIHRTFGGMPMKPAPVQHRLEYRQPPAPLRVESTLHQILGTEASLLLGFRIAGHRSEDRAVLRLLEGHLGEVLYQEIRVKKGLSYTPFAVSEQFRDAGILYLGTDSALDTVEETLGEMSRQVQHLLDHPLTEDEVEDWKNALLSGDARGLETNAEYADWYLYSVDDLVSHGHFVDEAAAIRGLTAAGVDEAAHRYLALEHAVTVVEAPLVSYRSLLLIILAAGLLTVLLIIAATRRRWMTRHGVSVRLPLRRGTRSPLP